MPSRLIHLTLLSLGPDEHGRLHPGPLLIRETWSPTTIYHSYSRLGVHQLTTVPRKRMSFSSPDNSSALELDPQQWRSEMMNRGPPSEGDQNRGPQLLAVIWIFTILALVVVSLKLYTRFRILREPGLDDAFTAVSVVRSESRSLMIQINNNSLTGFLSSRFLLPYPAPWWLLVYTQD